MPAVSHNTKTHKHNTTQRTAQHSTAQHSTAQHSTRYIPSELKQRRRKDAPAQCSLTRCNDEVSLQEAKAALDDEQQIPIRGLPIEWQRSAIA
jgi:hypothetical protein